MSARRDIQELIPESHRDLIEAAPRGFLQSAVIGSILVGAVLGSTVTLVVPSWLAATVAGAILVAQRIHVWISDREYDRRMAELEAQGLDWKGDEGS